MDPRVERFRRQDERKTMQFQGATQNRWRLDFKLAFSEPKRLGSSDAKWAAISDCDVGALSLGD